MFQNSVSVVYMCSSVVCFLQCGVHAVFVLTAAKEGAGAVDEEDFIKAFDDVPVVQVSVSALLLTAGE